MTGHERTCAMPDCPELASHRNRADQGVCAGHRAVVVSGSFVPDKHADGGHG